VKIGITGIGVVSAIGLTVDENLRTLKEGRTGIGPSARFHHLMGEVKLSNEEIIRQESLKRIDYSRTTLLSILAAKEAWGNKTHHPTIRTGLIGATSVGGVDRIEEYYVELQADSTSEAYARMTHDNGRTTERLAEILGITGYIGTISTACSSGANAILHGARLIEANKLDRVIVGGCDPLARFDVEGFNSLNIYDKDLCKPFDDARKGLNLGEGAGFLVLENEHSISVTGSTPMCLLSGWNNATDAFHQTASSADGKGAYLAMVKALEKAKLNASQIDYVNAHGTGTGNNDLSESMALRNVFGNPMPPFSSTKGFTGHTLAAAGAIEAVYSVLAIREQALLPNINFLTPMKETGLVPQTVYSPGTVNHVLSNSFGFGGNCTCLIFSKLP
jgi:3-oxoacyl-(acyl-carrier-protein) synthase